MKSEQIGHNMVPQEKYESDELFSVVEEKNAFERIGAATLPKEEAIQHKKQIVLEIKKDNLIDFKIIKENPLVYIGSDIDFEYPLSLGARNIILVDPVLKNAEAIQELEKRIKSIINMELIKVSEKELQFPLSNGEIVTIQIEPALYGSPETLAKMQFDEKEQMEKFQPPEKIGMILGFRTMGIDADENKESMERLVNGGYILIDKIFDSFLTDMTDEEKREYLYRDSPKKPVEIMKKKWGKRGYDFIPLRTEEAENNHHYTFIRKLSSD